MIRLRGQDNIVADSLSRNLSIVNVDFPDLQTIAFSQQQCRQMERFKERLDTLSLLDKTPIWCNTDLQSPRPFVPRIHRRAIFDPLHELSHPGMEASIRILRSRYFWPHMSRHIKRWVNECESCQESVFNYHNRSTSRYSSQPGQKKYQTVHIDIVGPLPPSETLDSTVHSPARYVVTFIDRTTRQFECCPVSDIAAETVAHVFLSSWVNRFGAPLFLESNQGYQFEDALFRHVTQTIGRQRLQILPLHSQNNEVIERFHRVLESSLVAKKEDWLNSLPSVEVSLRSITSDFSPFVGASLWTKDTFSRNSKTDPSSGECAESTNLAKLDQNELKMKSEGLSIKKGDSVWVKIDRIRRSFESPYDGPYIVLDTDESSVTIQYSSGFTNVLSKRKVILAKSADEDEHADCDEQQNPPKQLHSLLRQPSTDDAAKTNKRVTFRDPLEEVRLFD